MKLWIARNKNGYIGVFNVKPFLYEPNGEWLSDTGQLFCGKNDFPSLTFENSPKKVIITLNDN